MEKKDIIEVKNLSKKFGNFTAVDNISFEVKEWEIFAFLGPNGAGKTTTIKILITLLKLTSGIVAMSILFTSMFNGIEVILDRQFGFLKETLVAPVSGIQIMIGRTLGGATVAFLQGILVLLISILIGFRITNFIDIPLALVFMFLIALVFTVLGTAVASFLKDMNAFPLIINFIIMPLFFLSGALFPLEGLPKALDIVIKINPLSYGIDGVRGALTTSSFGLWLDFIVMMGVLAIVGMFGSYMFSKIEV